MRDSPGTQLTPYLCDQKILELRRRGLSYRAIGRQVHMSANGVMLALRRLQAGRPGTKPHYP
jgi:hypothetical protein